ncbi:MAG: zinc-ribbon domain-containing protein [Oscillospiraceae bacterium]|jgi:hypothetical protein
MYCPNCGKILSDGSRFCVFCGAYNPLFGSSVTPPPETGFDPAAAPAAPEESGETKNEIPPVKSRPHKAGRAPERIINRRLIFILIGVLAAALAIAELIMLRAGGGESLLYIKDGALTSYTYGEKAGFSISGDYSGGPYLYSGDGRYLYYLDGGGSLYCRDISEKLSIIRGADPQKGLKIAGSVNFFDVKNGVIAYIRKNDGYGGRLCISDLKEEVQIDSGVTSFILSGDGKRVLYFKYRDGESDLYEVMANRPDKTEKIASGVAGLIPASGADTGYDSYVYFKDSGTVYTAYYKPKRGNAARLLTGVTDWHMVKRGAILVKGGQASDDVYILKGGEALSLIEDIAPGSLVIAPNGYMFYADAGGVPHILPDGGEAYRALDGFGQDEIKSFWNYDFDGKYLYFSTAAGQFCRASVGETATSGPEVLAENITDYARCGSDVYYIKDGDLFMVGLAEAVARGISFVSPAGSGEESVLLVWSEYTDTENYAVLGYAEGGKYYAVDNEAYIYGVVWRPREGFYYLRDYYGGEGDLINWQSPRRIKIIDDEVSAILG